MINYLFHFKLIKC